jgi:nicotinate (nicotinamide) nucleotide adenylyltransferase
MSTTLAQTSPTPQRIAYYSGAFDPVHKGHVALAQTAVEQDHADMVVFVPCQLKAGKPRMSALFHRLQMLKLATKDLPWARVDAPSIAHNCTARQAKVPFLRHIREHQKANRPFVVLRGEDSINNALQKGDVQSDVGPIRHLMSMIIGLRGSGVNKADNPLPLWQQVLPKLGVKFTPIYPPHQGGSSTKIRQAVSANNMQAIAEQLHPAVWAYIQQQGLYGAKSPSLTAGQAA